MKLTQFERLVLRNQLGILRHLERDPQQVADIDQRIFILEAGLEEYYDRLEECVSGHVPSVDTIFARDVFEMFYRIKAAQIRLRASGATSDVSLRFEGFDGNSDEGLIKAAEYSMKYHDYDEVFAGGSLNAHRPVRDMYARMVAAWKASEAPTCLGPEDLNRIAAARTHPEFRGRPEF